MCYEPRQSTARNFMVITALGAYGAYMLTLWVWGGTEALFVKKSNSRANPGMVLNWVQNM